MMLKRMGFFLISMMIETACAGWYGSVQGIEEGIKQAREDVHGGAIRISGIVEGSAVIVNPEWVVTAAHAFQLERGPHGLDSFSFSDATDKRYSIEKYHLFLDQDLAFLKTAESLPKTYVAQLMAPDEHQNLIAQWKHPHNQPRANKGYPAFFFGYGHKGLWETVIERNKAYVRNLQFSHFGVLDPKPDLRAYGIKAKGTCRLSQYFPQTESGASFFSWFEKEEEQKDLLISSGLPGDSGGGLFVEQEGGARLVAVASQVFVDSKWDEGKQWVGTSFSAFYSPQQEKETESFLETVLRVS
ncbi:MAG: hypothetical protein A2621_04610 [Alphaproteobacteria bacterium RIFCSPHIGHO2_01_FULL_41_14]|nr:MAG: hypothetical protein A2065_00180 [Alphaproteobacteria bacterium GWB1_45_5]OFW76099.1 MAG: hypothetical protein A3K20_03130 [Alphaproteobacteria bacterium GWA1_45_9]OFW90243.1 MAG: hypothetical protein A2621_04610 [Alphaproteobacteria bacterium RIFCSPHIGHO2_01_FULL_41_14]